jgi:hypothetical protein
VQVWMRIHGLSQEYWRKRIIFAIASSVGTPICVDAVTSKPAIERTFGHYARVLVDIDVSNDLKYEVLVERKGFAFVVEFEYENLPEFCNYCKIVGHNISVCRKANKKEEAQTGKADATDKGKEPRRKHIQKEQTKQKQWASKEPVVVDLETGNVNSFAALQNDDDIIPEGNNEPEDNSFDHLAEQPVTERVNNAASSDIADRNFEITRLEHASETDNDDDSSQGSEFVDATQRLDTEILMNENAVPIRVQQDIQFLNEAWANLEDAAEVQIRSQQPAFNVTSAAEADIDLQIQHEVQNNISNSGFQLVTRKSPKKKTHKALSSSKASSTYLTRSKVPDRHSQ